MIARAPGKVVLSGAYAVLEGAPALVAAVGRFVEADAARPAQHETDEVRAAVELGMLARPCAFDASALRSDGGARKLGLGSSAAILVATMAAVEGVPSTDAQRAALVDGARRAHRQAQGGGSGVDVAASVLGGVLLCRVEGDALETRAQTLPDDASVLVLSSAEAASTAGMLARVRAFAARDPAAYRRLLDAAGAGAVAATLARSAADLIVALTAQRDALGALGEASGAPIVTADVATLARAAAEHGAFVGPAGAGGGDVTLLVSARTTDVAPLLAAARACGLVPLAMEIGARGVHQAATP